MLGRLYIEETNFQVFKAHWLIADKLAKREQQQFTFMFMRYRNYDMYFDVNTDIFYKIDVMMLFILTYILMNMLLLWLLVALMRRKQH